MGICIIFRIFFEELTTEQKSSSKREGFQSEVATNNSLPSGLSHEQSQSDGGPSCSSNVGHRSQRGFVGRVQNRKMSRLRSFVSQKCTGQTELRQTQQTLCFLLRVLAASSENYQKFELTTDPLQVHRHPRTDRKYTLKFQNSTNTLESVKNQAGRNCFGL